MTTAPGSLPTSLPTSQPKDQPTAPSGPRTSVPSGSRPAVAAPGDVVAAAAPGAQASPAAPAPDVAGLLATALDAVRAGARLALDPGEALRIDTKRDRNDVVTQVDRGVESLIAGLLAPTGYGLVGEEGHAVESWAGRVWVLDPIDGTLNYVAVHRSWAISLALVEDGVPVLGIVADPVDDRLYVAIAGVGAWEGRVDPWRGAPAGGIVADPVDDRLYVALAGVGAWEGRVDPWRGAPAGGVGDQADSGARAGGPSAAGSHGGADAEDAPGAGDAVPGVPEDVALLVPGAHRLRVDDVPLPDGVVIAHLHVLMALRYLPAICRDSRGMRSYGAAALELAEVAAGRAGVLVHTRLQPWDVAAGVLLCLEAGAAVTRVDGTRADVREAGSLLVGTPSARAEVQRRLTEG